MNKEENEVKEIVIRYANGRTEVLAPDPQGKDPDWFAETSDDGGRTLADGSIAENALIGYLARVIIDHGRK